MNRKTLSALALAVATLASVPAAFAADTGALTREQVRAALAEARRTGDLVDGDTGQKLNQIFPNAYPKQAAAQGLSREQVKAELAEARRTGDLIGNGESGQKLNEMYPGRYSKKVAAEGLTREQVKAELAEARRNGELVADSESGERFKDQNPARYSRQAVKNASHTADGMTVAGK